jgi:predicted AAA+ superfamily ATPase
VSAEPPYIPRLIDARLERFLTFSPATLLTGPRGAGKTTAAIRHVEQVVRLDNPRQAAAFTADPDAALRALREPALLDEWQEVPEVLWALKRSVDTDPRPGRFLLTGSVRADLDRRGWPGTGRVMRLQVWPLVQRELVGASGGLGLIQRIIAGDLEHIEAGSAETDLVGYLELCVAGGFPQAVLRTPASERPFWYASYLEQILTSDASRLGGADPLRLRRYLEASAAMTGGAPTAATLAETASIDVATAGRYDELLSSLGVLAEMPAWATNRVKRLTRRPKRFLTDMGVTAAALSVGVAEILADGDLLGRFLEGFVAAQLRAEVDVLEVPARLYHVRDSDGREVDLLVDLGRRGLIAFEVKATSSPTARDARHLRWLREHVGDLLLASFVLHTGSYFGPLDGDDILAAPISVLWSA